MEGWALSKDAGSLHNPLDSEGLSWFMGVLSLMIWVRDFFSQGVLVSLDCYYKIPHRLGGITCIA